MKDVAEVAGVSTQTVSRVFRHHPYVSADARRRVLDAVDKLGYRLNPAARALSSGRTRVIGVMSMATESYAAAMTQASIELVADELGYSVVGAHLPSFDPEAVDGSLDRLERLGAEALILAVPIREGTPRLDEVTSRLPTVAIDAAPSARALSLGVDQREVGRMATEHLLSLGHRTVWHLSGPDEWFEAHQRMQGWKEVLREQGRDVPERIRGDWSPESGHRAGRILGAREDVTAVFAANDEMAFGLIRGLVEAGRNVPADVSVVGVDDVRLAAYCTPPLTTIAQPFAVLARQAVSRIAALLDGNDDASHGTRLTPLLVRRDSTTAPQNGL
ncbi:LacI family DNA-binding transcriptional regulator [Brevibacterium sediminis]|uniref:LacI family DNA-binding transcriptional regulator n=1 Tax=Brevibacterium sediminis TaxID=1857024 RepID=UPI003B3ABD6E